MRKYLELFKDGFDATIAEKIQVENYPFVGYDEITEELVFTIIPKPRIQQNNEVWYTTLSGEKIDLSKQFDEGGYNTYPLLADHVVSHTTEDGVHILEFDIPVCMQDSGTRWVLSERNVSLFRFTDVVTASFPTSQTQDRVHEYYFEECKNLTSVILPSNISEIGAHAFDGCESLTSFIVPSSVQYIGSEFIVADDGASHFAQQGCFQNCTSLSHVTIPNSVKLIGGHCFMNCPNLTEITFNGTQEEWNNIEKEFNFTYDDKPQVTNWNSESSIEVVHCVDGDIWL